MTIEISRHRSGSVYNGFDVLVIGSGMGGLSSAVLLAREGYRVLVLERDEQVGGMIQTFDRAGFQWSLSPFYVGELHKPDSVMRCLFDDVSDGQLDWQPAPSIPNRIIVGDRHFWYPENILL